MTPPPDLVALLSLPRPAASPRLLAPPPRPASCLASSSRLLLPPPRPAPLSHLRAAGAVLPAGASVSPVGSRLPTASAQNSPLSCCHVTNRCFERKTPGDRKTSQSASRRRPLHTSAVGGGQHLPAPLSQRKGHNRPDSRWTSGSVPPRAMRRPGPPTPALSLWALRDPRRDGTGEPPSRAIGTMSPLSPFSSDFEGCCPGESWR